MHVLHKGLIVALPAFFFFGKVFWFFRFAFFGGLFFAVNIPGRSIGAVHLRALQSLCVAVHSLCVSMRFFHVFLKLFSVWGICFLFSPERKTRERL